MFDVNPKSIQAPRLARSGSRILGDAWNAKANVWTLLKVCAIDELKKSQSFRFLSLPAVIRCEPAGWKSTVVIQSL